MSNNSSINGAEESLKDDRLAVIILLGFFFICSFFLFKIPQNTTDYSDEKTYDLKAALITFYSTSKREQGRVVPLSSMTADLTPFFFAKLPVNTAGKDLLMTVKGVGPALAGSIINNRFNYGPFLERNDLLRVKGIGKKRAEYFETVFDFGVE